MSDHGEVLRASAATTGTPARPDRDPTIDIARGAAILAIVAGHVLRGLTSADLLDPAGAGVQLADRLLYSVHLAVFAFLTGLFVRHSVERSGVATYVRARVGQFLYLYLVWQILQTSMKVVTSSLVNTPKSLADVLQVQYPEGQLWYLPLLLVVLPLLALARPWRSRPRAVLASAVAVAVGLVAWGLNGPVAGTQGLGLVPFFVMGALVGSRALLSVAPALRRGQVAVALVVCAAVFVAANLGGGTPPTTGGETRSVVSVVLGVLASGAGVVVVLALSWLIARSVPLLGRGLAALGRRSLEIFLAHIVFTSGTRIVLTALGVDSAPVHLIAGVVLGVAGSLLLSRLLEVLRFPWLFQAPAAVRGERRRTAPTA